MKKLLPLLLLPLLAACESERTIPTTKNPQGETIDCVSLGQEEARPDIQYGLSTQNIVMGVVMVETVIVPVWVLLDETYCPVREVAK